MLRVLSKFILRMFGWTVEKDLPLKERYVLVGAPHTSNWDLPLAILGMLAMGLRFSLVAKHTLFKWPIGPLFKAIGGIPIDRRIRTGFVDKMVELFTHREKLILAIIPEGTRSKTPYWKTGFYFIAVKAHVPIALGYLDYGEKKVGVGKLIWPTGSIEKDIEEI
ncbi:MAG: lysophospholipid acyltransferase family protein, partial [Pseudomonadota bacterium]